MLIFKGISLHVVCLFADDLVLPSGISIHLKDHDCQDHVENLYYSCGYEPICIHCGEYLSGVDPFAIYYPQCEDCKEDQIMKRWWIIIALVASRLIIVCTFMDI
jgi:hypothetical protein